MKFEFKFWIIMTVVIALTAFTCNGILKSKSNGVRQKVVAEVNGDKILNGELLDIYESEKANYGITKDTENDPEQKENISQLKQGILDSLVYEKVTIQQAEKAGYTVTDKDIEQAKGDFNNILKSIEEQMKSQPDQQTGENIDYTEKAKEYVDGELKSIGKTQDEYIQMIAQQKMIDKFKEKVTADVKVTDADLKSYYNTQLKNQKENPGAGSVEVELYKQAEVRVKHILIQLPEDQRNEFNKLVNEQKADEAKKYFDEKLKAIYPKAQEVLQKVKSGENFEKLIEVYGEDPGMKDNKEGYTVKKDGQFVPEFENASFKLKEGEVSGLVQSDFGYHIIKAYKITPEKILNFDEKKDEIKVVVAAQKKEEKWNAAVDEWMKKGAIKKYADLL